MSKLADIGVSHPAIVARVVQPARRQKRLINSARLRCVDVKPKHRRRGNTAHRAAPGRTGRH